MLNVFVPRPHGLERIELTGAGDLPDDALWIDLLEPTPEEEALVERALSIEVPTREEMKEIETSNRLYEDNGALHMTATVAAQLDTDRPVTTAITFILVNGRLVTNRHIETKPFQHFAAYAQRHPASCQSAVAVLAGLIEALTARIADILERVGNDLDSLSGTIFTRPASRQPNSRDLRALIEHIGFNGELNSKARESLVSLGRLLMFAQQSGNIEMSDEQRDRFQSISRDVISLSDHTSFLGSKVVLPPGSDARPHQRRTEQHHQDLLRRRRAVPAADADREHLRHELRAAAAPAGSLQRLSVLDRAHDRLDGRDVRIVQAQRLAVSASRSDFAHRTGKHCPMPTAVAAFRRIMRATTHI
jgi:Mg2+ and Co2+ transporters